MSRTVAVLLGVAGTSFAKTVPVTTSTVDERACRPGYDHFGFCDTTKSKKERLSDLIASLQDDEIPALLTAREGGGGSPGPPGNISRLGMPAYDWGLNCIHGVQSSCVYDAKQDKTYCPTSFPNPVNLGSSWNSSMWNEMGAIMGLETRALWLAGATEYSTWSGRPKIGLDCWSPNININHDPRWGRNQEVPGEDPYLNGIFGQQVTEGLQRSPRDAKRLQAISTIKHWDAYTLEDSDGKTRHNFNAIVSNQTLSDTFFPAWKLTIVDGQAQGVMCSYNALNGEPTCASPFLSSVMRGTWNFTGYITSDTGAVSDIYDQHHFVATSAEAACAAIKGGTTDIDSGAVYHNSLLEGVKEGHCSKEDVDAALEHSLGLLFDMGLFDPIENQPLWNVPISVVATDASLEASKLAARESMVLLKNSNDILPLKKGSNIALIGPHVNASTSLVGNYFGQICVDDTFNCVETPTAAISKLNVGGKTTNTEGCTVTGTDKSGFAAAVAAAGDADIVVMMLGLSEKVEAESHDRTSIDLPGVQKDLITAVAAKGKPMVLVLVNGGMVALGSQLNSFHGIIDSFYPGIYGSQAIASTLFGTNPNLGGKMPYTVYPADFVTKFNMSDMEMNRVGTEGRSYKFYKGETEFDFGFGLSYTTFSISTSETPLTLNCEEDFVQHIDVTVKNTGSSTGDEVVMVYKQGGVVGSGLPLIKRLVAFKRVHLAAGESTTVSLTVSRKDFSDITSAGDRTCNAGSTSLLVTNGNTAKSVVPVTLSGSAKVINFPDV
eukprot:TRINITY_DN2483_c1_g2_i2.p1 TRINITY_DN2483_c1_g2~~TRINITY_DN2483_c1_g2_i2.p1  ORF type:complete len:776 (+),score=198.43 TRINITY_DN2483_c1_g2_i2:44-2371(+)